MFFYGYDGAQYLETDKEHIAKLHDADDGQRDDHLYPNAVCLCGQGIDLRCGPLIQIGQKLFF